MERAEWFTALKLPVTSDRSGAKSGKASHQATCRVAVIRTMLDDAGAEPR
jgi:hypothetical protein